MAYHLFEKHVVVWYAIQSYKYMERFLFQRWVRCHGKNEMMMLVVANVCMSPPWDTPSVCAWQGLLDQPATLSSFTQSTALMLSVQKFPPYAPRLLLGETQQKFKVCIKKPMERRLSHHRLPENPHFGHSLFSFMLFSSSGPRKKSSLYFLFVWSKPLSRIITVS